MPRPRLVPSLAILAGTLLWAGSSGNAQQIRPSFDCHKASFPDERAICADDRLAEMDQAAAIALGMIKKDMLKSAREADVAALKDRRACGANKICILDNQANLIDTLKDDGATVAVPPWVGSYRLSLITRGEAIFVSGLPKRIGTCTRTKISGIGTRFGDTLKALPDGDASDPGSSVAFADDGHQVSYSYEAAIGASAIGDDVVVCLMSLPRDCPPGDDRGKFYSATNLRTKGSWILPDSQHMCGGA